MSSAAEHNALVAAVREKYGRHPDLRLFLNSKVRFIRGEPQANPGLGRGSSDLIGIYRGGRFCAFECKTGDAVCTKEQEMFLHWVREMGGFACIFHSLEEFDAAVARCKAGASE